MVLQSDLLTICKTAQHRVQRTAGVCAIFKHFQRLGSFSGLESVFSPAAANANRWHAPCKMKKQKGREY